MPNIRKWSTTATGNASVAGGVTTLNWAEQQPSASVNNTAREMMAQVRGLYKPSEWGWVEHSSTASVASQTTIKIVADVTADYIQGRRLRLYGGSTIMYGNIVSSSFTAETTVTLVKDSGSLSASMSIVAVAAIYNKNSSGEIVIKKLADETVNTSDVLQNDDHLFFAVAATTNYKFEFDFFYSSAAAADFKFDITGPAAATLIYMLFEYTTPDGVAPGHQIVLSFGSSTLVSHATGTIGHINIKGILHNGANAGTVQLQWAQGVSNASNTVVRKGSTLRYSVIP